MSEGTPITGRCDYCRAEADCRDMTVIGVTFKEGRGEEQKNYWHLCPRCASRSADFDVLCDDINCATYPDGLLINCDGTAAWKEQE